MSSSSGSTIARNIKLQMHAESMSQRRGRVGRFTVEIEEVGKKREVRRKD